MTMQVKASVLDLKRHFKGRPCWIVGCGPSMDKVNLGRIANHKILALNAAITAFTDKKYRNAFWFYRDRRIVMEVKDRLDKWKRSAIITYPGSFQFLMNTLRWRRRDLRAFFYDPDRVIHQRTVVEDALQIAAMLEVGKVFLLGIDHQVEGNRPYARMFSWKECHFYNPKEPPKDGKSVALGSMVKAMKDLKPKLGDLQVFNTSEIYPEPVFETCSFDQAVELCDAYEVFASKAR